MLDDDDEDDDELEIDDEGKGRIQRGEYELMDFSLLKKKEEDVSNDR